MGYLHLFTDNFIVDGIIGNCEKVSKHNRYVVFSKKPRFVKSPLAEFFYSYRSFRPTFDIARYERIFIHYLGGDSVRLILEYPDFKNYYWFLWGADGYSLDELRSKLYLPLTREWLIKHRTPLWSRLKRKVREIIFPVSDTKRKAIERIAYCCTYIDGDVDLVRKAVKTGMKQLFFTYQSVYEIAGVGERKDTNRDGLVFLVGNSINPTNNHLEVLHFLKQTTVYQSVKLVIPLSYSGTQQYASMVKRQATLEFTNVLALESFIPREEYQMIMNEIDIAVFFHTRQQASNTIIGLLWLGKLVIMRRESTLFQIFRSWELSVVASDEINSEHQLNQVLDHHADRWNKNRQILLKYFSDEAVAGYYRMLFETPLVHRQ